MRFYEQIRSVDHYDNINTKLQRVLVSVDKNNLLSK